MRKITTVFLAMVLLAGAGCNKTKNADSVTGSAATPASSQPPKPFPAQLPDVLARVNGEDIKKADLEMLVRNVELSDGQIAPERRDEVMRDLLDQLIVHKLLQQETSARNIAVSDAEVDERLKLMKGQFTTTGDFEKALASRNMSEERVRADSRVEIAIKKLIDSETDAFLDVTDEDVRDFYQKNQDMFKRDEAVRASHILLKVDEKADESVRKKRRAEIDRLLQRARAGEDFAKLAKEHSEDQASAVNGGDLDFFARGRTTREFEEAAFALKTGQMSDVVTTKYGYHIIKVTDWRPPSVAPLEGITPQVRHHLVEQRFKGKVESLIAELKKKSRIEVLV